MPGRQSLCSAAVLLAAVLPASARAQEIQSEPLASWTADADVDSGWVRNEGQSPTVVFSAIVFVDGAAWLQLNLEQADLGNGASLVLTALLDGGEQHLNPRSLAQWQNRSAYFNGDAVLLELLLPPGDAISRVRVRQVVAGVVTVAPRSICGSTDDRQLSSDPRVARALPIGCTAWLIEDCNHCFLSAGHCEGGSLQTIEFNVPLSNADRSLVHPPPRDQYAVDSSSFHGYGGNGVGDDWSYFGVFPNSNTGLTPFEAQQAAFALAAEPPPADGRPIRITGYGSTTAPVPPQWYLVQKTHTGPYAGTQSTTVQYVTDTTGGNSGSPIIDETSGLAIGIHTHGGCREDDGANNGTALRHAALQAALAAPRGVCTESQLAFTLPDGLPDWISSSSATVVRVRIGGDGAEPAPGTELVHIDVGNGPVATPMRHVAENEYEADFPPATCGEFVQFFFSAESTAGQRFHYPGGCTPPAEPFRAMGAASMQVLVNDGFEAESGWTAGAPGDNATAGVWNRMDPQRTIAQPEDDHTPSPGALCWVTDGNRGSGDGSFDVDNGRTTLVSPAYDLSMPGTWVSYWRWYSNDRGSSPHADVLRVEANSGAGWVNVETVGPEGVAASGGWQFHEFAFADVAPPTSAVQFRFIAEDGGPPSIVEAALDDFQIRVFRCTSDDCAGDVNGDLHVDLADLAVLLSNFGAVDAARPQGDLDADSDVDLSDLAELLTNFGGAC